jgi:hypothetical protein
MAFSVAKSRPFRTLGLYRASGKHAAPKGWVPEPRLAAESDARPHRPAHAATMPRLTDSHTDSNATDADASDVSATDTDADATDADADAIDANTTGAERQAA